MNSCMMLHHAIVPPGTLSAAQRDCMFSLFATHYAGVTQDCFAADLAVKTWVILLLDEQERIRGFSTQELYPVEHGGIARKILFSGDTIVEPACWGSQELVRGWCAVAARMLREGGSTPCYWFLISKGYRTYLYLPLFFKSYHPHHQGTGTELKSLLDELARAKFGSSYDPISELIQFEPPQARLGAGLDDIPQNREHDPAVNYFLQRNPDFAQAVELACLATISLENTHGIGTRLLTQALAQDI